MLDVPAHGENAVELFLPAKNPTFLSLCLMLGLITILQAQI